MLKKKLKKNKEILQRQACENYQNLPEEKKRKHALIDTESV